MTFNAVGSTALDVHDHSRTGVNCAQRVPGDESIPARVIGTNGKRLGNTPMVELL
jgi:hypothetical protein